MNHVSSSCLFLLLFGTSVAAQQPLPPQLIDTMHQIRRDIPSTVGEGSMTRIVKFDPDANMLHDIAILWSSHAVTFSYAPEAMEAFCASPIDDALDIALLRRGASPAIARDNLLVATGTALKRLSFTPSRLNTPTTPGGFAVHAVSASSAWQQVVRLVTHCDPGTNLVWVLGLAPDLHTIRLGTWGPAGIVDQLTFDAVETVQQMIFTTDTTRSVAGLAARTTAGLRTWAAVGPVTSTLLAAPATGPHGAIADVHTPMSSIAWMVPSGSSWLLRVYSGGTLVQESTIAAPGLAPARFRLVGLSAAKIDNSGVEALVVHQNSTPNQLVLVKDTQGFGVRYHFAVNWVTPIVDACPALLDDINNDGRVDFLAALDGERCLQMHTGLPLAIAYLVDPGEDDVDYFDYLGSFAWLATATNPSGPTEGILEVPFEVPVDYQGIEGLQVQVIAWPQHVGTPAGDGPNTDPYQEDVVGDAAVNLVFGIGTFTDHPRLEVDVIRIPGWPGWDFTQHYYFLLRCVQTGPNDSDTVTWASPAQMVGFLAGPIGSTAPDTELQYLNSISTGQEPAPVTVLRSENRDVGVIKRPHRIHPPRSTTTTPEPGNAETRTVTRRW